MPDVFEVLAADHTEVRRIMTALDNSPGEEVGASDATLAMRKLLAQWLVIDISSHEAAEEQYLWPAVREHLSDGDHLADEAIAQEREAKQVLDKLDKLKSSDPEFDELVSEFIPVALEHIQYEECRVWPKLVAVLSAKEAIELGAHIIAAKERGPTRPHPRMPPNPAALRTAGPAAGFIDQLRDVLSGRGDAT